MKRFLIKSLIYILILELFFQIIVDPFYFYVIDTFVTDKTAGFTLGLYLGKDNNIDSQIEFIFIGSSRMPAAISLSEFNKKNEFRAVNAGRGYMTGAITYWGLKKKLKLNKDYLKGVTVVGELQGSGKWLYTQNFKDSYFETFEEQSHLILPHMNFTLFIKLLAHPAYSYKYKIMLSGLYLSAIHRDIPFFRSKILEKLDRVFLKNDDYADMVQEGGIVTDEALLEETKKMIIKMAEDRVLNQINMNLYNYDHLNKSMLNAIIELVEESGGKFKLIDMPQHSIQKRIFETEKNIANGKTLRKWLESKEVQIIEPSDFIYGDDDFPDYMHLSRSRRNEFSQILKLELEKTEDNFYTYQE